MEDWSQLVLLAWTSVVVGLVVWVFAGDRSFGGWGSGKKYLPNVLIGAVASAVALGTVGQLCSTFPPSPEHGFVGWLVDGLSAGLLAVVLQWQLTDDDSAWTRMARVAGGAGFILVAYEAITQLFAKTIADLRLSRCREHVIVYGLGRIGRALVEDLSRSKDQQVVVVERDATNPNIKFAEERGAIVVIGDATDERLLSHVRSPLATHIYLTTGSDDANVEALTDLLEMLEGTSEPTRPAVMLHFASEGLGTVLQSVRLRWPKAREMQIATFNVIGTAVDAVFQGPVLEHRPVADHEAVHFIIVGFGQVGQALTLQLASLAHFENLRRPRMTILYRAAEADAAAAFQRRHPRMMPDYSRFGIDPEQAAWTPGEPLDDWRYDHSFDRQNPAVTFAVNGGFAQHEGGLVGESSYPRLFENAGSDDVRKLVFFCDDSDELNCIHAVELANELEGRMGTELARKSGVVILPHVSHRRNLSRTLKEDVSRQYIVPWGDCSTVCRHSVLTTPLIRPLAECLAADYDERFGTSKLAFDDRSAWDRLSNLSAAAHVNAKLAVHGLAVEPDVDVEEKGVGATLPAVLDERLPQMEHNRWMAERLLAGWCYGMEKSNTAKTRPTLVAWDDVPSEERDKDVKQLNAVFAFLREQKRFRVVGRGTTKRP